MHPDLSFEQAPPIGVPLRFLLAAPWFGVFAGLLLAWSGESAVASRWSPAALAVTHLMVVGYLLQAMVGALFQFVPVAAGGNVWRPRLVAGIVQPLLIVAAAALASGFLAWNAYFLRAAGGLFLAAVALLVAVIGVALLRTPARGATIVALRMAMGGLAITVLLGAMLAEGLAGNHRWQMSALTNVHAAWGLGGWVLMLVLGVSYFVVPMFQLTPPYPATFARRTPQLLVALLALWSLQLMGQPEWLTHVWPAGLAVAAVYALLTLWLQQHRRRRISDPTFMFFRGAMICLLAAFASSLVMVLVPAVGDEPRTAWWLGVLVIAGTFASVINGMAYKIVPFLCWLHLQRRAGIGKAVPNMREMISEPAQLWQMRCHFVSVALLLLSAFIPRTIALAGLAFAISSTWLGLNLLAGAGRYRHFRDRGFAVVASPAR